jgi:hypothetical protein
MPSSHVIKIKAGRIGSLNVSSTTYVGEHGTIFYDEELGDLRLSDGVTPGGIPLTFNGNGIIDLSEVNQSIIPAIDSTYDLGSPSKQWRSMYVSTNTIYINNVPISLNENNSLTIGGNALETTLEIDGGDAFTVYTAEIDIDGGGA